MIAQRRRTEWLAAGLLVMCLVASPATAQYTPTFSIDFQGPTAIGPGPFTGVLDGWGLTRIDEGSILTPAPPGPPGANPPLPGPLPPPGVMVTGAASALGSIPGGLGIVPGLGQAIELDALSYGHDFGENLFFSVDEFAVGIAGSPAPPNVSTEGAAVSTQAAADVFHYLGPGPHIPLLMPSGLPAGTIGNTDVIDGDGTAPFGGPGLGLIEPIAPTPGVPDQGDNLDAVDVDTGGLLLPDPAGLPRPIFFSMDSQFLDPLEAAGAPIPNTGTAVGNGFVGGDVVVTAPGLGALLPYAPAPVLGLDIAADVPDSDDLDALALWDDGAVGANNMPFFDPSIDIILFSVRRGSAVIGAPDSRLGIPIVEGDVLTIPLPTALGGVSPFPAIYATADDLGLTAFRGVPDQFSDDLDALDVSDVPEPGTWAMLLGSSLTGAWLLRRRRTA